MKVLAPTTNTISSSVAVMAASTSSGSGTYVAGTTATSGAGNATSASGPYALTGSGVGATGTPVTTSGSALTTTALNSASIDATTAYTATITDTATFPTGATQACSVNSPFSSVTCSLGTFSFPSSSMTSVGSLTTKAYASNGLSTDSLTSNALPVYGFIVTQVSNTRNSNTATDGVTSTTANPNLPSAFAVYGGKLYFVSANSGGTLKNFTYSGTTLGSVPETTGFSVGEGSNFYACGSYLYYGDRNTTAGVGKIYSYDGTTYSQLSNTTGSASVADTNGNSSFACGSSKFFAVLSNGSYNKLFSLDASSGTVTQISNFLGSSSSDFFIFYQAAVYNGLLYFGATNSLAANKLKIMTWNDTSTTLTQFSNTNGSSNNDFANTIAFNFTPYNSYLFFVANNSSGVAKILKTDGTTITAISATSGAANKADVLSTGEGNLIVYNNKLYFAGYNSSTGTVTKLFAYDDTATTPTLTTISNTSGSSTTTDAIGNFMAVYNSKLFFSANNPSGYSKLYSYDGSTLKQITNTAGSSASDTPTNLTVYNGRLYFAAKNANAAVKLFVYDDTHNFVAQVTNTTGSESTSDSPSFLTVFGTQLYFASSLNATGPVTKLFRVCDTSAGCTN
jgi:hypothetical protein